MAVVTREDDQAVWEAIQALTVAQAQDRERVAKLEVQVSESDKRLATKADVEKAKADVEKAIGSVQSDIRVLRIWLFVGLAGLAVLELAVPDDINLLDVLLQLRHLGGG